MLEAIKILPPPWIALPEIERGSMHWRMGIGEVYADKWAAWYRSLSDDDKQEYLRLFPEPIHWRGCISHESDAPVLQRGGLSLPMWQPKGKPKYNHQTTIKALQSDGAAEICFFWGHQPARNGSLTPSCFSQWWSSDFVFADTEFCCMEQCMMAGKALLFRDHDTLNKILQNDDPKAIKALGRQVQGFQDDLWNECKYSLILMGNYHKFAQNPALRSFLLSTGNRILVEASPYDRIWGIGLPAEDPRAQDPRHWQGENLLGFALMEVRDEIRRVYANITLCCDPWTDL